MSPVNEWLALGRAMPSVSHPGWREKAEHWLVRDPGTIVLQPTSLCPLACTYCYLPQRHLKQEMSPATARVVASGIVPQWSSRKPVEVVWHGGETLALGRAKLSQLLDNFEPLRLAGYILHKIQTGATLITDEWCEFFDQYDVAVGVSIDGPRSANRQRVDRGGHPAFDHIMSGITTLKKNGIPFTALSVVNHDNVNSAHEVLDFLAELGCSWIGLNLEARESANANGDILTPDQARQFWRHTFTWSQQNPGMKIREIERLLGFLALDPTVRDSDAQHDLIPTIGWNGDVILLSPELLGVSDPHYHDFIAGNVHSDPLSTILERAPTLAYVQEFIVGLERCKASCEFFTYCQGAHAGNRYFEHEIFSATETEHCRTSFQAPVLALADLMETGADGHDHP
ncbi:MAG: cyclophane-forming radical SAM peptide maturase AmcB [Pseudonocardiaceae bacterium]